MFRIVGLDLSGLRASIGVLRYSLFLLNLAESAGSLEKFVSRVLKAVVLHKHHLNRHSHKMAHPPSPVSDTRSPPPPHTRHGYARTRHLAGEARSHHTSATTRILHEI